MQRKAVRNQQKDKDTSMESEWFTEQNLETSQNELTRNITSKSNILAPFNSTLSDGSEENKAEEMIISDKRIIKLAPKVRDVDRQYEKNNNCELDNGVYNKLMGTSSDGKENDSDKELNPLSSNDNQQQDGYIKKNGKEEIKGTLSPEIIEKYVNPEKVAAKIVNLNSKIRQPLEIDKKIIERVENFGYSKQFIIESIDKNKLNHASASYFLLLHRRFKK